MLTCNNI